MGFITDLAAGSVIGGAVGLESSGEKAAERSARALEESGRMAMDELQQSKTEGQGFLQPFQQLSQQGLEQANFLTDPNAQFDFLQNNPLFQMGLDNANTQTNQMAASRGRLSAGDTLQQLNNNALLTAAPLIGQQKQSIQDLLSRGFNNSQAQANTALGVGSQLANAQTEIGNARAGGIIGQQNAQSANQQNLLNLAGQLGGFGG
tara:strand:- start:11270 stop:11884 length:615 start_codon:yes stop_codon:yes gene_type:complete